MVTQVLVAAQEVQVAQVVAEGNVHPVLLQVVQVRAGKDTLAVVVQILLAHQAVAVQVL